MERKTIGKFISALRRAKGLTQKELGDMLYVSDKTISRWECDECLPDLYLIPAIAEIFGITSDELLRGEKNSPLKEQPSTYVAEQSERRAGAILTKKFSLFRNLSFIAFGLALIGAVVAVICAVCGYEDDVTWLGFLLPAFLAVAAVICEAVFALNAIVKPDDELGELAGQKIFAHNAKVMKLAMAAIMVNAFIFGICIPLCILEPYDSMYMLFPFPGLGLGCMFALAAYGIYFKGIRPRMISSGKLQFDGGHRTFMAKNNKLLLVVSLVCGILYALLFVFIRVVMHHPSLFIFEDGNAHADYSETAISSALVAMFFEWLIGAAVYCILYFTRIKKLNIN